MVIWSTTGGKGPSWTAGKCSTQWVSQAWQHFKWFTIGVNQKCKWCNYTQPLWHIWSHVDLISERALWVSRLVTCIVTLEDLFIILCRVSSSCLVRISRDKRSSWECRRPLRWTCLCWRSLSRLFVRTGLSTGPGGSRVRNSVLLLQFWTMKM